MMPLFHYSTWDNPYVVAHGTYLDCRHAPDDESQHNTPCWAIFLRLGSGRSRNPASRPSHLWSELDQPEWYLSAFSAAALDS